MGDCEKCVHEFEPKPDDQQMEYMLDLTKGNHPRYIDAGYIIQHGERV